MSALMMRVKRPRVRTFIGKVKSIISGLTRAFIRPNINEVTSADQKELKDMPGTILATRMSTKVFKSHHRSIILFSPEIKYDQGQRGQNYPSCTPIINESAHL